MTINQCGKDRVSGNDHKKGNRTNSKRETGHLQSNNTKYKNEIDSYKAYAENRRRNRTYTQEELTRIYDNVVGYFKQKDEEQEPYTVSGLLLATGLDSEMLSRMKNYEYDYRLYEYIDIHGINEADIQLDENGLECCYDEAGNKILLIEYSSVSKKAYLKIEEQTESRLYKSGKVGDIFALKARHNWQEEDSPSITNQTLVIASEEQARRAIELLK